MARRLGFSLFWRTFILLAALLLASTLAWLQTVRAMEYEPRALQTAQQLASLVNLSRAALVHADAIARLSLIRTLAEQEGVRVVPREPTDRHQPLADEPLADRMALELARRLGSGTVLAASVNGEPGLWVSFGIEGDPYWLYVDRARLWPLGGKTWVVWIAIATVLSLAGAALIAGLINRPLKQLSFAASRLREGDFQASRLNEQAVTSEIREVNIGFNRMADRLAKIEQDRAVMLAGISHDLRTPLARLRLETELSVADPVAREHMVADIAQLDAIIDKFLDYARPDHVELHPVSVAEVVESCVFPFHNLQDIQVEVDVPVGLRAMADEVELGRVLSNLLENARRYGATPGTAVARVQVAARERDPWVVIQVRDHGPGVDPDTLQNLTRPFYRGDAARTAASGTGLGLAVVERTVQRMSGEFVLTNSRNGGLSANIRLRRAR